MVHTSLEQNSAQASAFQNFHRYASDTPLIHKCVTALLKTLHLARLFKRFNLQQSLLPVIFGLKSCFLLCSPVPCSVMIGFDWLLFPPCKRVQLCCGQIGHTTGIQWRLEIPTRRSIIQICLVYLLEWWA